MKHIKVFLFLLSLIACKMKSPANSNQHSYIVTGSIERLDPLLDNIIDTSARPEIIAKGFEWSEGPLWIEAHQMLLFSDVPGNTIYKWTEAKGTEVYLQPSGYTGSIARGGETGSNGLLLDPEGRLVLCQHGNRQMARMDAPLDQPKPNFIILTGNYRGKKYNSPNDAAYNTEGDLFFTDPPYGLERQMNDSSKEIPYQGVYRLKKNGEVVLLTSAITRPNGIALMPGEKKLLVANSDPKAANWYQVDVDGSDSATTPAIFHSAATEEKNLKGLPDGFKIDRQGNIFASAPGGIWIFKTDGKLMGKVRLQEAASNVALSTDEKTLYITNDMYVLRLKMRK